MATKREILKTVLLEEFGELTNEAFHKKLNTIGNHREYILSLVERAGYRPMSYPKAYAKVMERTVINDISAAFSK